MNKVRAFVLVYTICSICYEIVRMRSNRQKRR